MSSPTSPAGHPAVAGRDHEGPVSWYANQERLLQAQRWRSLERYTETSALLDVVLNSLEAKSDAEEDDQALLKNAKDLHPLGRYSPFSIGHLGVPSQASTGCLARSAA